MLRSCRSHLWRYPSSKLGLQRTRKKIEKNHTHLEKNHQIDKSTLTRCGEVSFSGSAWLGKAMVAYKKRREATGSMAIVIQNLHLEKPHQSLTDGTENHPGQSLCLWQLETPQLGRNEMMGEEENGNKERKKQFMWLLMASVWCR